MIILSVLHTLIIFLLARLVIRSQADDTLRIHGWVSLALKILAGWGIGLLYIHYYGSGDTLQFHELANSITEIARLDAGHYLKILTGFSPPPHADELLRAPRLFFMVKLVSIVNLATNDNYWISAAYFSFFSWIGLFSAASAFSRNYPSRRQLFLLAGLYMPSVLFWASGLTKESVAVGAAGLILSQVMPSGKITVSRAVLVITMSVVLWMIKYYYFLPLSIAIVLFYFLQWARYRTSLYLRIFLLMLLASLLYVSASMVNANFDWEAFPEVVYHNYLVFQEKSDPGDAMTFYKFCGEWGCLLQNFPLAAWGTLFRPYVFEADSIFKFAAGVENMVLLVMFIYFLAGLKRYRKWDPVFQHATVVSLIFILLIAGFLGLSAPNFGTLARYRVIMLPVAVVLFLSHAGIPPLCLLIKRTRKPVK